MSDYPPVTKWLTTKPSFPYLLVDTDTCFYSNPIELLLKYKEEGIYLRESAYIIDKIANQRKEFILNNNCPNIFFSNTGVVLVNTDSLNSEKFDKTFKEISSRLKKQINSGDFSKFIFSHEWILEEVTFDLTLYQLNIKPYQFDSKDILQGKEALTSNPKFISHYFSINTKEYRKKLQED